MKTLEQVIKKMEFLQSRGQNCEKTNDVYRKLLKEKLG